MSEDTGKGAYGTVHVMEEQMRAAGQGVFEEKSGEFGRKALGAAPKNKMANPVEDKAEEAPPAEKPEKAPAKRAPAKKKVQS